MEKYLYKTITKDNFIISVYRPVLTPDEYERRLNNLKNITAQYMSQYYAQQSRKENTNGKSN